MATSKKSKAPATTTPPAAQPSNVSLTFDRYQRWRLILGKRVDDAMGQGRCKAGLSGPGEAPLSREMAEMDAALGAIYDREDARPEETGRRSAGLGGSHPKVSTWLGDIRTYFESDVVAVIQQDAIEKKGWKQLLFEPEALAQVTPSIELVGTLLSLKGMIPDATKETARQVIRKVVEAIQKRMQADLERAVRGALDRSRHQPIASLPNLDWKRTLGQNLKNYLPEKRTIVPDRFFFYARQQRHREWNVIVCMDQSGSMAESVIYGSVMGSILASLPALETHVVAFDTEVVDLTAALSDPVDLLFGIQLGGGTDIHRAVAYCQHFIHTPQRTLFILLTDLYEGSNESGLVRRMADMASSGVRAMCLLALSDSGVPSYHPGLAKQLADVGVPCFACTPNVLPLMLEAVLKGRNLDTVAAAFDTRQKDGR